MPIHPLVGSNRDRGIKRMRARLDRKHPFEYNDPSAPSPLFNETRPETVKRKSTWRLGEQSAQENIPSPRSHAAVSAAATKAATASVVVRSRLQEPVAIEKDNPVQRPSNTTALLRKGPPHQSNPLNCLVVHWRVRIATHGDNDGSKAINLGSGSLGVLQLPRS
jgi:hypothetical protein